MIRGAAVEPERDFATHADGVRGAFAELLIEMQSSAAASVDRSG
jgi:hypothetical protein